MQTMKILKSPYSQRGMGLGSIFSSLARVFVPVAKTVFRASKPIVKKVAAQAGKEALQVGLDTLGDVASGQEVKSSLKRNFKAGSKRTLEKVGDVLNSSGKKVKLNPEGIKGVNLSSNSHSSNRSRGNKQKKKRKKTKTIFD